VERLVGLLSSHMFIEVTWLTFVSPRWDAAWFTPTEKVTNCMRSSLI
jgi:hypothetical protein